jgi:hypothetical protein
MTQDEILARRLFNQQLTKAKFTEPQALVSWLGAVQAQEYADTKWGLGMRLPGSTASTVEDAYNQGLILRTHVMRPTWHLVAPTDLRWLQELTSDRVLTQSASMFRQTELDEKVLAKAMAVITKALEERELTRQELGQKLEEAKIPAKGQRLAYIIMFAEVQALICSGPRKGKQFTYALVGERVPKAKKLNREEALARLTLTYFTGHGPAGAKDFAWWSNLLAKDVALGLELVKNKLEQVTVAEKTFWFAPGTFVPPTSPTVYLMSIFDEYIIAYKDRTLISEGNYIEKLLLMGNALLEVIVIDGRLVGAWKKVTKKDSVVVVPTLLRPLNKKENQALKAAVRDYSKFWGLPVSLG